MTIVAIQNKGQILVLFENIGFSAKNQCSNVYALFGADETFMLCEGGFEYLAITG